jgi:Reverse transcriptase (RNA-dependent DNA polymerase)
LPGRNRCEQRTATSVARIPPEALDHYKRTSAQETPLRPELDLKDFFPMFNFGRVRGVFIHNNNFKLNDKVATIIAQIASFENVLPQGSPCSPVIADLIAHLLDVRPVRLAKQHNLTYSRYADDLLGKPPGLSGCDCRAHCTRKSTVGPRQRSSYCHRRGRFCR